MANPEKPAPACFACAAPLDCPYQEERCPNLHPEMMTQEHRAARNAAVRKAHAEGISIWRIAEKFGLTERTIHRILFTERHDE